MYNQDENFHKKKDINKMTLSLNPTLTQNKEKNTEIQVANTDLVTQHKPMPQLEAQNTDLNTQDNTESNKHTSPRANTPNTKHNTRL